MIGHYVARCPTNGVCPVLVDTDYRLLLWRNEDGRCEGCGLWPVRK